jgi:hypothetical protein
MIREEGLMRRRTEALTTLLAVVSSFVAAFVAGQEAVVEILNSRHAVDNLDRTLAIDD